MQLAPQANPGSLRTRLAAAAMLLLASSLPAAAADGGVSTRIEASGLLYGEAARARVVEPSVRITRLLPDGQALSASLGLDVITGASPTGAMPAGRVQTSTTPSGHVRTTPADAIPTNPFRDVRGVLDLGWSKPVSPLFTTTLGAHVSREKDYQSLGGSGTAALDVLQRRATVTFGAGYSHDGVMPQGGTRAGLGDGTAIVATGAQRKRVGEGLVGLSGVLTRRWLVGVSASRTFESGYLTEPYKLVSLVDPVTGFTTGSLTEQRPGSRDRYAVLASSVYHFSDDVLYTSYRRYRDDWGVRSHTLDVKYRHELGGERFVQPHVRYYTQTAASFFRFGLHEGAPLPREATSDFRLGPLRSATFGATYGFRPPTPFGGELTLRAEYLVQWGDGHPADAVGVQRNYDLFPPESIGSLVIGYTLER